MIRFRSMTLDDVDAIVGVIADHDDDDGEAAQRTFATVGPSDFIVLEHRGKPAGVTGCAAIAGSDRAFWLSWTYLDRALRGKGLGRQLVEQALGQARQRNGRKIFLKISDYRDPDEGDVYGAARRCYAAAGFRDELTIRDYYDAGENLTVMGLDLVRSDPTGLRSIVVADERPALELDRWFEIAETDGAYAFSWRVRTASSGLGAALARSGGSAFNAKSLASGVAVMRERGARVVFLSFPSNLPLVHEPLRAAGFDRIGVLTDYYGQGLNEVHFAHYLN